MFINRSAKILLLAVMLTFTVNSSAQKMTADEVVARHLDSIGTKENRGQIRNQAVVGETSVRFITQRVPPLPGRIVLISEGGKNFFGMKFESTNYSSERFSFDGKKGKVGYVQMGQRTILGNFIKSNENILENGLLGGTLSSAWALLNSTGKKPKVSFDGTKKIGDKEAYVLNYAAKGGGDITIRLFFDKETFQHVRTEYKRISSAGIGTSPDQSSKFSETRLTLTENFSDFKPEKGLTLPHDYKLLYSISGQNGTTEVEWSSKLTEFGFNMTLAENTFNVEAD